MPTLCPARPICRNVLHPDFDRLNIPAGYDPTYNYVGSQWIKTHFGVALKREFCGSDINRAAWLHDCDFSSGHTFWDFFRANRTFRKNIQRLLAAPPNPHPWAAMFIAWFHWIGVSNALALVDYWLCK